MKAMRQVRHVARMRDMTNSYNILVGKFEGKSPLGLHRRIWECNIRIDFREIEWEGVDWMYLAQDRDQWRDLVKTIMSLPVIFYLNIYGELSSLKFIDAR
jgi:hypothetical protein